MTGPCRARQAGGGQVALKLGRGSGPSNRHVSLPTTPFGPKPGARERTSRHPPPRRTRRPRRSAKAPGRGGHVTPATPATAARPRAPQPTPRTATHRPFRPDRHRSRLGAGSLACRWRLARPAEAPRRRHKPMSRPPRSATFCRKPTPDPATPTDPSPFKAGRTAGPRRFVAGSGCVARRTARGRAAVRRTGKSRSPTIRPAPAA